MSERKICFFSPLLDSRRRREEKSVALRITDRDVNGVKVLDLDGRLVLGDESNVFRERFKALMAAGKKRIVLNLANVTYIDSAGLGTLVATFNNARSQGATMKLANVGSKSKDVLQLARLMTLFDIFDSDSAAVASFGASA
jgi:anti-sigma B factor antagonist